jgi:6-pyruvoyltetrahydropterin/6-carboxytetrahydropterin synthase
MTGMARMKSKNPSVKSASSAVKHSFDSDMAMHRLRHRAGDFRGLPPAAIMAAMHVRLVKSFGFEAAHDLPTFPQGHKCRRLHGHSFRVDVIVEGEVPEDTGYLIDYGQIKDAAEPIVKELDHRYLNEIEGLSNPTSENLARWIYDRLKPALSQLSAIIVHETCTSSCEYRGS